jgi:hypothetical protein
MATIERMPSDRHNIRATVDAAELIYHYKIEALFNAPVSRCTIGRDLT